MEKAGHLGCTEEFFDLGWVFCSQALVINGLEGNHVDLVTIDGGILRDCAVRHRSGRVR